MYRKTIVGVFLLIAGGLLAQKGTTSPYSFYGIGIHKFSGTMEHRAMGGLGVFSDSIHLNLQNPAGYASLKLVNFSVGASHLTSKQHNTEESQNVSTTALDYLAIGIPMGKMGLGFGLMPYTTVGYHFYSELDSGMSEYSGNGGLNKAFLSLGYQLLPELAIGIDSRYNFGKIENTVTSQQNNVEYGTRARNSSELHGFSFNFGAIYKKMITDQLELSGAVSYSPSTNFTSDNYRNLGTVSILPGGIFTVEERSIELESTQFKFPSQFTIGGAISKPKYWGIGIEYVLQESSDFSNRTFSVENITYENASKLRVGGFFIPNYSSFGNYLERVVYRAGARFEQTGLSVDGHGIDEFGISFGLGMPVGRMLSNLNLGFEIGRRGTTDHGLIQENFFNTFLSFSLNDRWFEKRFID